MSKALALLAALAVLLTVPAGCGADGKSAEEWPVLVRQYDPEK